MSKPILYGTNETKFENNGLGVLSDCVSCTVTEERNGAFELEMQYPISGLHYQEIVDRSIIKAKSNQTSNPQLFRVYSFSRPIGGVVTIRAAHISYDLSGIPVKPFSASGAVTAMGALKDNAVIDCPFDFWTDKDVQSKFGTNVPASIRSLLGGVEGSILDVYGGEWEFDNYTAKLWKNRGKNRGVSIRYGKNLTDLRQEQNCSSVYTGIYPYWAAYDSNDVVEIPGKIMDAPGTFNFRKIKPVDFSSDFEAKPPVASLSAAAERYLKQNNIGVPNVSLKVSFVQLDQSEEYKGTAMLERVQLCDTVNVEFPALGVSTAAKVNKVVYNVLLDRVESVEIGDTVKNLTDTVVEQDKEIAKKPDKSYMENAIDSVTSTILGANGGAVRLLDTNNDGMPDTLYIADDPDPMLARKVWRFNYEGWAASKNGYGGPFTLGATLDDGLLADFVTAANLVAGSITGGNGRFRINLTDGVLTTEDVETYKASDYTQDDVDRIKEINLGTITPTQEDYRKYDFDKDGRINITDLVTARRIVLTGKDLVLKWGVTIDPNDRNKMLVISRDNGEIVSEVFRVRFNGVDINSKPLEDYVIEQGQSNSWHYRKWVSGRAECWGKRTANFVVSSQNGSLYSSSNTNRIPYPFSFTSPPAEMVVISPLTSEQAKTMITACVAGPEAARSGIYRVLSPTIGESAIGCRIDIVAAGYWK